MVYYIVSQKKYFANTFLKKFLFFDKIFIPAPRPRSHPRFVLRAVPALGP